MKRKIAAILAADIAGYSKLVAEDEEETLRRLASYRSVFDDFIAKASGRVFNTAGDAVLAEFPSAVEAVRCAIDIQESLRTRNLAYPASRQMNFRMGITIGDVVEREGDLLGDGVNIAARLQTLAEPGGICVSRSIYEQVSNKLSVRFADIGEQQVKNIPTPIHAYTVASASPAAHERAPAAKDSGSAKRLGALALLAVVVLAGAGAAYWTILRKPASAPIAAAPSPKVTAAPAVAAKMSPPPAVKLRYDEARLRTLAEKESIPLPRMIHIVEPSSAVSKTHADYLGAWGGEQRWGNGGRHVILLVTYIDDAGKANGVVAIGPPTERTGQAPANYIPFTGTLTGDELKFETLHGKFKYQFKLRPDGIMEGQLETPNHKHPTITIERLN
jgi:class 3 adenylate cyclase